MLQGGRPRWTLLALVLLLHAAFVLVVQQALQVPPVAPVPRTEALQARFVPFRLLPPPPVPLPPPPPPRTPPPQAPPRSALSVHMADTRAPAAAPLVDRTGQPLLPAPAASSGAVPDYVQRLPQGDPQIMRNVDPVRYKATRFEQYFPPVDETAGGAVVRHVVDAVVKSADVDLPRGIHLECTTVLGIPTPNCRMPPAKPSAKDGDERLSMAPARPLAADPHAPPAPTLAACIALYRAGKPLQDGCPTDTPARAVDAELQQRARDADRQR